MPFFASMEQLEHGLPPSFGKHHTRKGWPAVRLLRRCDGGLPVARGEKGTPWRVHQQGGTGWADAGGGKGAVEKVV
jgi:hypothetical protein